MPTTEPDPNQVRKALGATTTVDGHQHVVYADGTSAQTAKGASSSHTHTVVMQPDGKLVILADSGHTHELASSSSSSSSTAKSAPPVERTVPVNEQHRQECIAALGKSLGVEPDAPEVKSSLECAARAGLVFRSPGDFGSSAARRSLSRGPEDCTMTPTVPNLHRAETLRKAANDPELRADIEKGADRGCRLSLELAATWSEKHARALQASGTTPATKRAATVAELDAASADLEAYVADFATAQKLSPMTAHGILADSRDALYLELTKRRRDIESRVHPVELERARHAQAVALKRQHDAAQQAAATETAKRAASDPLGIFNAEVQKYAAANGLKDEGDALVRFLATPDGIAAKRAYDKTRGYSR